MLKGLFVLSLALGLGCVCSVESASANSGAKHVTKTKRGVRGLYSLVPPPPPMAVSPSMLAAYPQFGGSMHMMPSRPHHLAEEMKLTAVMDDTAFFKLNTGNEGVHLKQGNCYQTVTVAQITPEQVVLEEKGIQYIKYLK
ncbi:MAG: hypothetical protein K2X81_18170 [Candidatus Obscuribacterales bacterium]|nr:hypothetical protein [Candidatus Obscuribacterales bacterium]